LSYYFASEKSGVKIEVKDGDNEPAVLEKAQIKRMRNGKTNF
jgi:YHS domain-containing protein